MQGSKIRNFFAPNRVVAYLTGLASLASAIAVVWGGLNWTSTVGVMTSLCVLLGVAVKWLDGWQKHEARESEALQKIGSAESDVVVADPAPTTPTDVQEVPAA